MASPPASPTVPSAPRFTQETFKPLLKTLVQNPEYFTPIDLKMALEHLFTPGLLPAEQIGSFLTALHVHRVERRPESLAAAASVLRERAVKAEVLGRHDQSQIGDFIVDIVGTGGDGYNLFNVSTAAAIVAAGAGARVVKHGSRASTSSSGAADILEALGCTFPKPNPGAVNPIPCIPFYFILAPHYHHSLAFLAPFRKALPFRTMFNILGPLINPAFPDGMVLGIAEPELGWTFAESLKEAGMKRALVVCGQERMDEISCAGTTNVWELDGDQITASQIHPTMFGLGCHPLTSVAGGTPKENAAILSRLLKLGKCGETDFPKEMKPLLDFILINASALLVVAGVAKDFREGVVLGMESVASGKAWEALEAFKKTS